MASQSRNNGDHAGNNGKRKKGSAAGSFFTTLLLLAAIGVFCFSGWKLLGYYMAYKAGSDEYASLNDKYVRMDSDNDDPAPAGEGDRDPGSGEADETDPSAAGGADASSSKKSGADTASSKKSGADTASSKKNGAASGAARSNEYIPEEHGETGTPGVLLRKVEELEDPETLEEKISAAAAIDTEENRQKKRLPVMLNPIDFKELHEINPEVIGWIRIGALEKSYPVAQAKDNDFYLHRTFEKQDNFAGCIFLNCGNSKYFTDQNSIIYGHNMKNGSMFGTLRNFTDQATYNKNPYFWIFTPQYIFQYRIFSCSIVSKIGDPYRTRFSSKDYEEFLKTCIESSEVDTHGVKPTVKDRIVTLSTCTGNESTRLIVQGVLQQIYVSR